MTLTAGELEAELKTLLFVAHRLMPPLNQRPEIFHEQKDALARAIGRLMERCGFGPPRSPRAFTTPPTDCGATCVVAHGRRIPIERRGARQAGPATAPSRNVR